MRYMISALSGLVFGLGLMISDMANPARVKAFLSVGDIATGTWDPTLMFVMGGAMAISALAWLLSYRRATSLPQALAWLRDGSDSKLLAGGQTLLGAMKLGLMALATTIRRTGPGLTRISARSFSKSRNRASWFSDLSFLRRPSCVWAAWMW